jgi:hypothetical protein
MQILSPHPSKAFGYEQRIGYVLTLQFMVGSNVQLTIGHVHG